MPLSFYRAIGVRDLLQKLSTQQIDHMGGVGIYAGVMAQKIDDCRLYAGRFSQRQIEQIGEAAFYHDIGKVWLPQEILLKRGPLTTEESVTASRHTLLALRLFDYMDSHVISGMPDWLILPACDAAVYHHERWDGSGYPFGLCGENIPLIARISAICDCYDKETAQKGNGHQAACRSFAPGAGTRFDPALAQVFIRYHQAFAAVFYSYRRSDWF